MFTLESEAKTLDLASFVSAVKTEVLKEIKGCPPFNLFSFQYIYMYKDPKTKKGYTIEEAARLIINDLKQLKRA